MGRRTLARRVAVAAAATVLSFALTTTTARGENDMVVGDYVSGGNYGIFTVANSVTITTFLSPDFGVFSGEGTLFETPVYVSGANVQHELTFGGDPDFPRYVELLTDGRDWYLYDQMNFDDGITKIGEFGFESDRLPLVDTPPPPDDFGEPGSGPDLQGYEITRILRSVQITMDTPGSNPNGDGNWTDVVVEIHTQIFAVPEPGAAMIAALGGVALLKRKRTRT